MEKKYQIPEQIDCDKEKKIIQEENKNEQFPLDNINILCVKWGTRYNAEYVNKLYRGIQKYTKKKFTFYCFTEDPTDLVNEINVVKLKENWKGWWGKATLFSQGILFFLFLFLIFLIYFSFLLLL